MEYGVLGPVELRAAGRPVRVGRGRQQRLLAVLLANAGRVVSADELVEVVFAGAPPDGAQTTLRSYVARLRRVLAQGEDDDAARPLVTRAPGYVLEVPPGALDADRFLTGLDRSRRAVRNRHPEVALRELDGALALWRGRAYGDLGNEPWVQPEAVRLDEARVVAREEHAEVRLLLGQDAGAVPELRHLLLEQPLRERPLELLLVALHRAGARAEALEAYRDGHRRLAEAGLEPSRGLQELGRRLAAGDSVVGDDRGSSAPRTVRGYQLGPVLGTGATATVHRAVQPGTGRDVALKLLRSTVADEPTFIRTFEAEARLVARLEHPHVVPLYDYWREPGLACFVMRLMRGGTLRDRLVDGPMRPGDVVAMAVEVGGALAAAHAAGVVHRDIRPTNVLFDEHGHAHLADFGIARGPTGVPPSGPSDFRAPEYGRPGVPLGRSADQYGLARLVDAALGDAAAPATREVIDRATAPTPDRRYPDVAAFVAALSVSIAGGDPAPSPTPDAGRATNPYKGLRPFDEPDADDFFGRAAATRRLLERVTSDDPAGRFVLVVGPSGSGKSSLVRAGLLPLLRSGASPSATEWFVATMVPGTSPFTALHQALATISTRVSPADVATAGIAAVVDRVVPGHADVVLVVDQLEDLFTLVDDATRRRFLHALASAATSPGTRVRVVATLRADAYDRALHDHRIGRLVEDGTVPVGAMDAEALQAAIVGPASRVGVAVEPALATTLVADVIDRPGTLPLLQFALAEAFEHAQGAVLDLRGYRDRGRVEGAVADRAEAVYLALPERDRDRARHVFMRLVHRTADAPARRVLALRGDLVDASDVDAAAMDALLDRFVRARLLTTDRDPDTRAPTIDIAHEALLEAWPRLRTWIADDAELLRVRSHLTAAAAAWDGGARDADDLYRGARLEVALDLQRSHPALLTTTERDYLAASSARRDAAEEVRRSRAEEQARVNRRLRRQRQGLAALLVGVLVVGLAALGQLLRAQQADRRVASLADSATLGVVSASRDAMTTDRSLALLLAVEARRASDSPATRDHEFAVLTDSRPAIVHVARTPGGEAYTALAADGETVVAKRADGTMDVYDLETRGFRDRPLRGPPLPAGGVAVQPGGTLVAAAGLPGEDGTGVILHDLATGRVVEEVPGPEGAPHEVAFSDDGRRLAVADPDGGILLRPVTGSGDRVHLHTDGASASALAFTGDGTHVIAGTLEGDLMAFATATGEVVSRRPRAHDGIVTTLVETPTGDVVSGGVDGKVAVWSVPTLSPRGAPARLDGTAVLDLDVDRTGTRLAIGGSDTLRLWSLASSREPEPIGEGVAATGLAFAPDGSLVVARPDGSLAIWQLGPAAGIGVPLEPPGPGMPTLSPDGSRLAVWGLRRGVQLFDAATLDHVGSVPLGDDSDFWGLAFVGDGSTLATLTCVGPAAGDTPCDGELSTWDVAGRRRLARTATPQVGAVFPSLLAASPDGGRLATGHADGQVRLWDARTLQPLARLADPDDVVLGAVNTVSFGRDDRGMLLAATNLRGEVSSWDVSGPAVHLVTEPVGVTAGFAPDGSLWTGAEGGRALARDPRTLRPLGVPLAGNPGPGEFAVGPAGDRVVTTSTQTTVWDVPSGQRVAGPIPALLLSVLLDDGETLVTGAGGPIVPETGDVVRAWPLAPEAWDRAACRAAARNLTREEWRAHLPGDRPYTATCPQWPAEGQ